MKSAPDNFDIQVCVSFIVELAKRSWATECLIDARLYEFWPARYTQSGARVAGCLFGLRWNPVQEGWELRAIYASSDWYVRVWTGLQQILGDVALQVMEANAYKD